MREGKRLPLPAVPGGCLAAMAGALAIAAGGVTLLGYAVGVHALAALGLHGAFMPETAVVFTAAGVALCLVPASPAPASRRLASQVLGLLVALFSALVLAEYLSGWSAGTDLLLFPGRVRAWTPDAVPGRLSPYIAVAMLFIGLTLALLDVRADRRHCPARILLPATTLVTGIIVISYLFDLSPLRHGTRQLPGIALSTTVIVAALTAGLLACRPGLPPTWAFLGTGPAPTALRQMVLAMCAGLLLIAAVITLGGADLASYYGLAVVAAGAIVVVTMYLVFERAWSAIAEIADALRDERDLSRTVLRTLREGVIVIGPDTAVLQVNERWCEISGFRAQDVVGGKAPYPWWPPDQVADGLARVAASKVTDSVIERTHVMRRPDGTQVEVMIRGVPVRDEAGVRVIIGTYHDLTEHNQAEADRRRAADQLDQFFSLSTDLLCIAGTDGYFKRLNPAWERALGWTLEELRARPWLEIVHPDDAPQASGARAVAAAGELPAGSSHRFRCRDGSYRWLSWNVTPDPDRGLSYAVARDITGQRQAEQAQARLAAIVDGTDDAIVGMTLDGIMVSWNAAAERLYGYQAREAIGQPISLITARPGEMERIVQDVARGVPVAHHSTARVRKDGTLLQVEVTISPVRDSSGSVVGAASIARDITERLKAEERFRRLVLAAPDAMVIVDSRGSIVLVNEQTERLFGYPAADLTGQPVELLVPGQLRERIQHQQDDPAAPQILRIGTDTALSGCRHDGTEFPVEISLAHLDTDEGPMASAAIRDVSERREAERALARARDEALAAAQLKSQFVAMVSHEIRTPMNGVIGLTDLLLDTPLQPPQRRYAEAIRTSGRALLTIINDILDFSKIEAGKIDLAADDCDLDQILDSAVQVAAETARDKELEIIGCYPPGLPTAVRCDQGRLRQVLLNLLGNAVKFTEHGEIVVRASAAGPAPDGRPQVTFAVADTGIGIAPDELAVLFQPFSQGDASAHRQFGGTGLGLTIARQLIELMGGHLDVQSQPGRGSTFSFTIPLTFQPGAAAPRTRARTVLTGRRVLIVDDNHSCRQLLSDHTSAWGICPAAVPDGQEALAQLHGAAARHQPYAAAIIDQRMPGQSGLDLARRITADPTLAATKLVLLTSGCYHDDTAAATAGAVLPKPVRPSQLYDCLLGLLGPGPDVLPAGGRAASAPALRHPGGDRGLILLAEDNKINQMVAADNLSMLGYRVDIVRNGTEAVQAASTKPYRAILMDCQMPAMDGYTATTRIRRIERPDQHIPIIAMTAGALAEDEQRCLAAGMDDYLAKPLGPDQLRAVLGRWTGDQA